MATALGRRQSLSLMGLRASRCNADGSPVRSSATGAWAQRGGLAKLTYTPVLVTGDDIAELDASGELAVSRKYLDKIKRFDLQLEVITESPEAHEILVAATLLTSGGNDVGYADLVDSACDGSTPPAGIILEGWSEQWQCNVPFAAAQYARHVFARCYLKPDPRTLQKGTNHFMAKGFAVPNSLFAHGPFNDLGVLNFASWAHAALDDATLPFADPLGGYIATPAFT